MGLGTALWPITECIRLPTKPISSSQDLCTWRLPSSPKLSSTQSACKSYQWWLMNSPTLCSVRRRTWSAPARRWGFPGCRAPLRRAGVGRGLILRPCRGGRFQGSSDTMIALFSKRLQLCSGSRWDSFARLNSPLLLRLSLAWLSPSTLRRKCCWNDRYHP